MQAGAASTPLEYTGHTSPVHGHARATLPGRGLCGATRRLAAAGASRPMACHRSPPARAPPVQGQRGS
jgi:hypothetical protein